MAFGLGPICRRRHQPVLWLERIVRNYLPGAYRAAGSRNYPVACMASGGDSVYYRACLTSKDGQGIIH